MFKKLPLKFQKKTIGKVSFEFKRFRISTSRRRLLKMMVSIVEFCIFAICVVCFAFNSFENLEKFFKSQTAIAVSRVEKGPIKLPAITFCNATGFKNEKSNTRLAGLWSIYYFLPKNTLHCVTINVLCLFLMGHPRPLFALLKQA